MAGDCPVRRTNTRSAKSQQIQHLPASLNSPKCQAERSLGLPGGKRVLKALHRPAFPWACGRRLPEKRGVSPGLSKRPGQRTFRQAPADRLFRNVPSSSPQRLRAVRARAHSPLIGSCQREANPFQGRKSKPRPPASKRRTVRREKSSSVPARAPAPGQVRRKHFVRLGIRPADHGRRGLMIPSLAAATSTEGWWDPGWRRGPCPGG